MSKIAVLPQRSEEARPSLGPADGLGSYEFSPSLVTLSDPSGVQAEAIRALRTHIMAQHVQQGRRALAVCGANPGVGSTFTAANLTMSLSQIGVKTLLLDCNLRTSGVEQLITPAAPAGSLRQCLETSTGFIGECIDEDVLPNLSVLYSGGPAPNAQELLASERFEDLMNSCLRDFHVTIVDTPPANSCSDARRVSTVVGYSLIVARRGRTFMSDVKTLVGQLRSDHAKVIGTVLNEG